MTTLQELSDPLPIVRSQDHRYYYEGNEYPGATGILGILDKPVLMQYAANQTADAAIGLMKDDPRPMGTILDAIGIVGFRKAITDRHRWKRDEAAHLGTEVHGLAEKVMRGEVGTGSDLALRHAVIYADWWKGNGWTRPLSEIIGVNPSAGYGGTLDLLARDENNKLTLADIKTGAKGVYREAILQLAAYSNFSVIQVGRSLQVMPVVDRHVIIHVTLDGVRVIDVNVGQEEIMWFLDCVDLYRFTQKVKGRL